MKNILNFKILSFILIILFISGCTAKKSLNGDFNREFEHFTNKNFSKTQAKNYVKDSIKEIIDTNKSINFDNSRKLSSILSELGQLNGQSYMLSQDSENIFIKSIPQSYKLGINSFYKLNQYIQDTSNYFLYIKKNRFIKNRVKIVGVRNQEIFEKDLKMIPFSLDGKMAIADILEQIKDVSGFSVIGKDIPSDEKEKITKSLNTKLFDENSLDKLFNNVYISFAGNNIMELLNYISASFNVYVDVDYENKNIIFSKFKTKLFNISLNNIEYSGTLDIKKSIKNDIGEGGSDQKSIKTKIKLDILKSLEDNLKSILKINNSKGSLISFNRTVGSVFIRADKDTMRDVSLVINNFNTTFEKQIDFKLEVYEFAVTKEFEFAISLGATIENGRYTGQFNSSDVVKSIFSLKDKSTAGNRYDVSGLKLDNKMIKLLKQTRHGYTLKNGIPYYMDATDSISYVKTITTTTTTKDGKDEEEVKPEISEATSGIIISILAKINGNKIDFNIQPKIVKVNNLTPVNIGANKDEITLPSQSTNSFTSNIILKSGERKIIGYLTSYEDENNYNGIVPIENFILGGARAKRYFRKETVYVITANIRD